MDFQAVIQYAILHDCPDLHLHVGRPPMVRQRSGDLASVNDLALTAEEIDAVITMITTPQQREVFKGITELDFSYHHDAARFRVNAYKEKNGPAVAFRVIPKTIPSMQELGLPEVTLNLVQQPHGLILVTGPTGMGKSTTLASMIEYINSQRSCHIITIEDPIEHLYESKKALITQRELSSHTESFPQAIRSALRQDPDVVLVGEMRDLETIAAAITLAETGHLVFSTLHTQDAPQTVDRIIDVFPAYQQQQIRAQLANTLKGVISQVLIPRQDGQGRVAARELLISNDGIRNCILQGDTAQIYSLIQVGHDDGMILMDQSLETLAQAGVISVEAALAKATDIQSLRQRLTTQ